MMKTVLGLIAAVCTALMVLVACATTAAPEDEAAAPEPQHEALAGAIQDWKRALEQQQVAQAGPLYSERFQHVEYGGKDGVLDYLLEAQLDGYLQDVEVDASHARMEVLGERAVVAPLHLTGRFGHIAYTLHFLNEAGVWRIVGSEAAAL